MVKQENFWDNITGYFASNPNGMSFLKSNDICFEHLNDFAKENPANGCFDNELVIGEVAYCISHFREIDIFTYLTARSGIIDNVKAINKDFKWLAMAMRLKFLYLVVRYLPHSFELVTMCTNAQYTRVIYKCSLFIIFCKMNVNIGQPIEKKVNCSDVNFFFKSPLSFYCLYRLPLFIKTL